MSVRSKSPPLKSRGLGTRLRQRIDRAIDDIQLSRMSLTLAIAAKRIEGGLCHLVVERHDDDAGLLQQLREKIHRVQTEACKEENPGFQDGDR